MTIRYLNIAVLTLLLPLFVQAKENQQKENALELSVYKTPRCGCCEKWIGHIEGEDIVAYSKDFRRISAIKNKHDIKPNYRSCHTAVTRGGFAFEGRVPAMPVGSSGLEVDDRFIPYQVVILFKDGTSEVYGEVKLDSSNTYEEQF